MNPMKWINDCVNEAVKAHRPGVQICRSNAGYYIGQLDEDGTPFARFSQEYFNTRDQAQYAYVTGEWTPRISP